MEVKLDLDDAFALKGEGIVHLLWADDLVLLSNTAEGNGLQKLLNILQKSHKESTDRKYNRNKNYDFFSETQNKPTHLSLMKV